MNAPASHPPLSGGKLALGTVALSLATFMNVLDTTIANVSIPAISGDLGVSSSQGTWVITSFAVANAIAVPLTGWLSQRFGQVRLFVASVTLFVIASLLCGLAPNMATLIAFRALQGFVAGPMIPLSQTLLLSSYPKALAGLAMAMWSMTTLVAPVMGPLLGGWFVQVTGWRWIFWFLTAFGVLMFVVVWRALPESLPKEQRHAFHLGDIAVNYWKVLCHRQFLLLSTAIGAAFGGFALYIGSAAYFIINILHLPETAFAWLFIPLISGMVFASGATAALETGGGVAVRDPAADPAGARPDPGFQQGDRPRAVRGAGRPGVVAGAGLRAGERARDLAGPAARHPLVWLDELAW